jgi:hypothetical protein
VLYETSVIRDLTSYLTPSTIHTEKIQEKLFDRKIEKIENSDDEGTLYVSLSSRTASVSRACDSSDGLRVITTSLLLGCMCGGLGRRDCSLVACMEDLGHRCSLLHAH